MHHIMLIYTWLNLKKDAPIKCPLKPHTYLRFLDDVFIIWTHGRESFDTFLGILNNHEPPIKFKSMINEKLCGLFRHNNIKKSM